MAPKELIVVGGPNGAGKTTFVEEYLRRRPIEYLGADQIAKELSPDSPESAAIAAGREFLLRVNERLAGDDSFIVETTLAGKSFRRVIEHASECGFTITIHFVFTDDAGTSVRRVAERVKAGGHNVPEQDIRRRFARSLNNFWMIYRPLADHWLLAYNGGESPVQVANGGPFTLSVHDEQHFAKFFDLAGIDQDDTSDTSN